MAKDDGESRTIETRLNFDAGVFECIESLLRFFARFRGKVWRELIIKDGNPNTLKSTLIREGMVTARHANSLLKEVQAKASSIEELQKEQKLALSGKIKSTERKIASLDKQINAERKKLKEIESYRLKVKAWKEKSGSKARKKPTMPSSIRRQFTGECLKKTQRLKEIRHQKSRRLFILNSKVAELQTPKKASICFGGKTLFNSQHHLEKTGFRSHEEWRETFRNKRSSSARHVWGFYADNRRKIRELLILSDKRPTHLSAKALSLAKEHPSLARSFIVILDRPEQVALHRATG